MTWIYLSRLYELYHHLNHTLIFGVSLLFLSPKDTKSLRIDIQSTCLIGGAQNFQGGYRNGAIKIMDELICFVKKQTHA